jgi:hypothetical protein
MRYTTVVWDPQANVDLIISDKLAELRAQGIETDLSIQPNDDGPIGTRSWPTLEAAEAWVTFCQSVGAKSASVDPE